MGKVNGRIGQVESSILDSFTICYAFLKLDSWVFLKSCLIMLVVSTWKIGLKAIIYFWLKKPSGPLFVLFHFHAIYLEYNANFAFLKLFLILVFINHFDLIRVSS